MSPEVGSMRRRTMRSSVVLPQHDLPISPGFIEQYRGIDVHRGEFSLGLAKRTFVGLINLKGPRMKSRGIEWI